MTNVSSVDAQAYTKWLSDITGANYRLLTGAEWDYAARAEMDPGDADTRFSWGDQDPVCSPSARNGAAFRGCARQAPWDVASFAANRFGLYDMHGNVSEWVEDCYTPTPEELERGVVIYQGALETDCPTRIFRGGAWYSGAIYLETSSWSFMEPSLANNGVGFRVARDTHAD